MPDRTSRPDDVRAHPHLTDPHPTERPPTDPDPFGWVTVDDPPEGRWSTWGSVTRLSRGPEPRPDWVVTDAAAVDTELGPIKSGKEAVCHLLRRAVPDDPDRDSLLVAKRYLEADQRSFHRSAAYTEGRRIRNSRDTRALARGSSHGRAVAAGQWAQAEWDTLVRLWQAGVSVPYPVQIDGTEILMEYIAVDGQTAPRLAQCRGSQADLRSWYDQVADAMERMATLGLAHGDLSPYNLLLAGSRVVVIDLPQVVDVTANPNGMSLLHRDCRNVCDWFVRRGLDVDADDLLGRLVGLLY